MRKYCGPSASNGNPATAGMLKAPPPIAQALTTIFPEEQKTKKHTQKNLVKSHQTTTKKKREEIIPLQFKISGGVLSEKGQIKMVFVNSKQQKNTKHKKTHHHNKVLDIPSLQQSRHRTDKRACGERVGGFFLFLFLVLFCFCCQEFSQKKKQSSDESKRRKKIPSMMGSKRTM